MNKKFENAIYIVLGSILGIVFGIIIMSFDFEFLKDDGGLCVLILLGVVGALTSIIIVNSRRERIEKQNERIRNETVALMTHEMRTSLTSTSWSISMVLNNYGQYLSIDDKKILEDIEKSIHTTVMHTVNLLDISLLDIGKLAISLEWVNLGKIGEMFNEVINKYRMGIKNINVQLNSNIELDKNKGAEIDILRLRVILENLLENSIQYMKYDSLNDEKMLISVDISNDKNNLNIIVKDNGIGIPKSEQEKIFEEFYRASNARMKLSSGSGIGLHMCEQYVKAHHGNIRFNSEEGRGTTFYIDIPLKTIADTNEFLRKV